MPSVFLGRSWEPTASLGAKMSIDLEFWPRRPSTGSLRHRALLDTGFSGGMMLPMGLKNRLAFLNQISIDPIPLRFAGNPTAVPRDEFGVKVNVVGDGVSEIIPVVGVYFWPHGLDDDRVIVGMRFLREWLLLSDGPTERFGLVLNGDDCHQSWNRGRVTAFRGL